MGLSRAFLTDLIELKRSGAIDGFTSVIEIGSQQLSDPFLEAEDALLELYALFGKPRTPIGEPVGSSNFTDRAPASRAFWASLGFTYSTIDYSGHRDSIALDLNHDDVPDRLRGAFQLVINAGTTEHVANQDNAFCVIHDLTAKGGVMYHEVPAQGHMNHGLFNYNPKFFWLLARENDYAPLFIKTCSWTSVPVPQEILDDNLKFGDQQQHVHVDEVLEFSIRGAFMRKSTKDYASPLDIPIAAFPLAKRPGRIVKKIRSVMRQRGF